MYGWSLVFVIFLGVAVRSVKTGVHGDRRLEMKSAFIGQTVKLPCKVPEWPSSKIYWQKNGVNITRGEVRESVDIYLIKRHKLVMRGVVEADSGNYTCRGLTEFGEVVRSFMVRVKGRDASRPRISVGYPKDTAVELGGKATFRCPVSSASNATVAWKWANFSQEEFGLKQFNGLDFLPISDLSKSVEIDGSFFTESGNSSEFENFKMEKVSLLTIYDTSLGEQGGYICFVRNWQGTSHSRVAWLAVLPKKTAEALATAETVVAESILVRIGKIVAIATTVLLTVIFVTVAVRTFLHQRRAERNYVRRSPVQKRVVFNVQPMHLDSDEFFWSSRVVQIESATPSQHYSNDVGASMYQIPPDPIWDISSSRLAVEYSCILGSGAFGTVYRGKLRSEDRRSEIVCAVKQLKWQSRPTDSDLVDLLKEMMVLKIISCSSGNRNRGHPNVISLLGCCTENNQPVSIILEYCSNGSLEKYLRKNRPKPGKIQSETLSLRNLLNFCLQVASGMKYLASKKCLHRDLAARNVLVTESLVMKISDFGFARDLKYSDYYSIKDTSHAQLPIKWTAPEVLRFGRCTTESDVWSMGILMWEIMTFGNHPYESLTVEQVRDKILQNEDIRMASPPSCPDNVYQLMRECWEYLPYDRPSFQEIVTCLERILADERYFSIAEDNYIV